MSIIQRAVGAMLPNGRVAGTSAEIDAQNSRATVMDLVTKEKIDEKAADATVGLILKSAKEAAGWTRDLFNLIRSCGDIELAKGSLLTGEARAIKKFRELVTASDPDYKGKIKSLGDIAKYQGMTQLSYSVTKSKLIGLIDGAEEMADVVQKLWIFENEHEGAPMKVLAKGYLDAFSERYADPKKGSTQFMRDVREAQEAQVKYTVKMEQKDKEKAKQAAAETGQNGEQTQQGIANGTNVDQRGLQVKSTQEALNKVIRLTHDADNNDDVKVEDLNGILTECAQKLQELLNAAADANRERVSKLGSAPIRPEVPAAAAGGSLPGAVAGTEGTGADDEIEGSQSAIQPAWIPTEAWTIMTEQERMTALDAGQKAWEEEEALIEQANEVQDAQSNEPKGAVYADGIRMEPTGDVKVG